MSTAEEMICPHCNEAMEMWEPCPWTGWDTNVYYCANDNCCYFVQGRKKICQEFQKNFAYRYCFNPKSGKSLPIITWCGGDLSLLKGRCSE